MPEKPKGKAKNDEDEVDDGERSLWSEDQKERGYYYDDAHGYEIYNAGDDEQGED